MIDFVHIRKLFYLFSATLIVLAVASLLMRGINLGVDFRGGAYLELRSGPDRDAVTAIVKKLEPEAEVQQLGTDEYLIRITARDVKDAIENALKQKYPQTEERSFSEVSSALTAEFRQRALTSILAALLAISGYIVFAFRNVKGQVRASQFGATTFIALIHDVMITVGFFSVMRFPADLNFIVAVLVVAAFSMHDTIVVFDRIRENLTRRKGALAEIVNFSLNETLTRSLNTSFAAILTLLALVYFVKGSLQPFVLTLIVGFVIGTYSSICLASQLLVDLNRKDLTNTHK